MKTKLKCFLVLLLCSMRTAADEDNSLTEGLIQEIEKENVQIEENIVNTPASWNCKPVQNILENLEDILDHKLNPLRKIILELQDDVMTKLETVAASQNDLIQKVNEFTNSRLSELATDIIRNTYNKIHFQEDQIMKLTEKNYRRLVMLENNVQKSIIAKLDNITELKYNQNRDIGEIADNIISKHAINITKQINDKIKEVFNENKEPPASFGRNSLTVIADNLKSVFSTEHIYKSIEEIKQKMVTLEDLEQFTQKIVNISDKTQTRNENKQIYGAKNIERDETGSYRYNFTSFCDATALNSIQVNETSWKIYREPEIDDLDMFLVNITGCQYASVKCSDEFPAGSPAAQRGVGTSSTVASGAAGEAEWRGVVRAEQHVYIHVLWGESSGVYFHIGEGHDTVMVDRSSQRELERRHTPGLLYSTRYTPVDVTLHAGRLTLWAGCPRAQLFSRRVYAPAPAAAGGARFHLFSASPYGAKVLYGCPF